ncbi:MAG: hypothetical protein K0V04_09045 [Deltaproteobacteria bacterium]|nr:hypothetical protein [Deltaproteobacteria bacterium]
MHRGRPLQVTDLGIATLDISDGLFAGDDDFVESLESDLVGLGWDVLLGPWLPATASLRSGLSLSFDDDALAEKAASVADVVRAVADDPQRTATDSDAAVGGWPSAAPRQQVRSASEREAVAVDGWRSVAPQQQARPATRSDAEADRWPLAVPLPEGRRAR